MKLYLNIIPEGEYEAERILIDQDNDLIQSINDSTDPSSY